MGKTRIEWVKNLDGSQGYTINPVKGLCPVACSYCYARRLYDRFKWNPEIRFEPMVNLPKKPSRIFVGSTMELFGEWIDAFWLDSIFRTVRDNPQHTFIFLTKRPENLIKWNPFPENCWVGVSATSHNELADRWGVMRQVNAFVKFVSLEPFLDWADAPHRPIYAEGIANSGIQWLIIGSQTPMSEKTLPKREWVDEIILATDKAGIPVFIKEPLASHYNIHRQEYPYEETETCL